MQTLKNIWRKLCPIDVPHGWLPSGAAIFCIMLAASAPFIDSIGSALGDRKSDFYGVITSSLASLVGFIITAAAIMLTLNTEQHMKWLAHDEKLLPMFRTFVRAIITSGIALVASIVGFLFDTTEHPHEFFQYLTIISLIMSFAYLAQTITIFAMVAEIVLKRIQDNVKEEKAAAEKALNEKLGPPGAY